MMYNVLGRTLNLTQLQHISGHKRSPRVTEWCCGPSRLCHNDDTSSTCSSLPSY